MSCMAQMSRTHPVIYLSLVCPLGLDRQCFWTAYEMATNFSWLEMMLIADTYYGGRARYGIVPNANLCTEALPYHPFLFPRDRHYMFSRDRHYMFAGCHHQLDLEPQSTSKLIISLIQGLTIAELW